MEKLILKGIAASNGIVEGVVKVVEGVKDISRFNDGDILVAKITEPSMFDEYMTSPEYEIYWLKDLYKQYGKQ